MPKKITQWPKRPPQLTRIQIEAREAYMRLWHEQLPQKYAAIEKFNHGYPASLPIKEGTRTLEIGAGLGEHAKYENLNIQEYDFLEYRKEFCEEIHKKYPKANVHCADIHKRLPFPDASYDRVVAIHVLEHLVHLPNALKEIKRILKPDGFLDIVIPCEGGLAHTFGRKISAERLFRRTFKMDFTPIHKNEHVSTFKEIMEVLGEDFSSSRSSFFPLKVPIHHLNFCAGFRFKKVKSASDLGLKLHDRLLEEKPEMSDAIVWLQGDQLDRASKVVELFKKGFSQRILLTGNNLLTGPSARPGENNITLEEMAAFLLEQGIPKSSLLVDSNALNTHGQAQNVLSLAKKEGWTSLLLVASSFHQVRAYLTFLASQKKLGWQGKLINQPAFFDWNAVPSGRSTTVQEIFFEELEKIQKYQGHVAPIQEGLEQAGS